MRTSIEHGKEASVCSYEVKDSLKSSETVNRHFQPLALSLPFILGICLVLVGLCVSDGLLWQFAKASGGFDISNANRYVLTYGPTAILVCVVAAWRQLDYYTKITMPWVELSKEQAPARRSVLLDYVSILQITACWKAAKNKHYPVVLTTIGFFLLKLAMLASTGLFVLRPMLQEKSYDTTIDSILAPKSFVIGVNSSTFDQSLFYTTYAVLVQNLVKPDGLGDRLAYSTYSVPETIRADANFTVQVDAFVPSFECKPATVDIGDGPGNSSDQHPTVSYQIATPAGCMMTSGSSLYTLNPQRFRCPARQISGIMSNINCSRDVFDTDDGVYKLLLINDIRYSQTFDNNEDATGPISESVSALSWNTEIAALTAVICRLSYDQQAIDINGTSDGTVQHSEPTNIAFGQEKHMTGFTANDLDDLVQGALSASDEILGSRLGEGYALEYPDPMFKTMAAVLNGSYETLMDDKMLMEAAKEVATQLSAQVAHKYLRSNASDPVGMFVVQLASKIEVTTAAAWVVFTCLISVTACCIILLFVQTEVRSSKIALPIARNATMPLITADPNMRQSLIASQSCYEQQLDDLLQSATARLQNSKDEMQEISISTTIDPQRLEDEQQPWLSPVMVGRPVMTLALFLGVSLIIILEVLQRLSDQHQGFIPLPLIEDETTTLSIRIIPALLVVLVASLYNSIDFNVLMLTPYHRLLISSPVEHLARATPLSRTPILALWSAIRYRHLAASVSTCAALVGSVLAIIVSGVFTSQIRYNNQTAQVKLLDYFQPQWNDSVLNDQSAALISSLVENLNFSFPRNTFDEIAIPSVAVMEGHSFSSNATISATLPVLRGDLQCTALPLGNISLAASPSRFQSVVTVNATYGLPPVCLFGGSNGTDDVLEFIHTFTVPQGQNLSYIGKILDLHVGPFDAIFGSAQGELQLSLMADNPLGCPSLAFIYGVVDLATDTNKVSVDVCYQTIQQAFASIQFSSTAFEIDHERPPSIDETMTSHIQQDSKTGVLGTEAKNATAFQYRLQGHFDNVFSMFNASNDNPFSSMSSAQPTLDPFFQGVFFGRSPLPLDLLRLKTDTDLSTVTSGIQSLYRRYMAQAISLNMRVLSGSQNEPDEVRIEVKVICGTAQRRLVQDHASKVLLQIMLAFMFICGVIINWRMRLRRLLVQSVNPCTIWGQMSLWAGCEYYEQLQRPREEICSGKKPDPLNDESNMRVQLGWWHLSDGRKRFGFKVSKDL